MTNPVAADGPVEITVELHALKALNTRELRDRYLDLFGAPSASNNKQYLYKRIAYRIQELREQRSLSAKARELARELARDAEPRVRPPAGALAKIEAPPVLKLRGKSEAKARDKRLPRVGTVLSKVHGGIEHRVIVGECDFEYNEVKFTSLSAIARRITGTAWNGFTFFGLTGDAK